MFNRRSYFDTIERSSRSITKNKEKNSLNSLETQVLACTCNGTVQEVEPEGLPSYAKLVHQDDALCRRGMPRFLEKIRAADSAGAPVLITCTQESSLFRQSAPASAEIKFINTREHAGWGQESKLAQPKIAALIASAAAALNPQLPAVGYHSSGRALVIADNNLMQARLWVKRLQEASNGTLQLSLLWLGVNSHEDQSLASSHIELPKQHVELSGSKLTLQGWLGAFSANWIQSNPIDLEACVSCGACVSACPEKAISTDFQVSLDLCKGHRSCVSACGTTGAIDFQRLSTGRSAQFDSVLDFRNASAFERDAPQGYFWGGLDAQTQTSQAMQLLGTVGEFEKPKYFDYKSKICAHGRNEKQACNRCIDACSTGAIQSKGDQVSIEPHLCMGCGACATTCPTGAMRFQAPDSAEMGRRLRTVLSTYRKLGGKNAAILFYDRRHGNPPFEVYAPVGKATLSFKGLPARVLPVEVEHCASIGLELLLAAKAYGGSQVFVLQGLGFDAGYTQVLTDQIAYGNEIVTGLGLGLGLSLDSECAHFSLLDGSSARKFEAELWAATALKAASVVAQPGSFELPKDKREALAFTISYLAEQAGFGSSLSTVSTKPIALSKGAPFGAISVRSSCTLCMACTSVCPKAALLDGQDKPQLRFIQANCVQCGLCVQTCPERAISLVSQLDLDPLTKQPQVVSEAEPIACTSCGKAFGTKQMVEAMISRLTGHSMFAGSAVNRLKMCADCRVIDMMHNPVDGTIHDYQPQSNGAFEALTRDGKSPNR